MRRRRYTPMVKPTPQMKKCSEQTCRVMCTVRDYSDTPFCERHTRTKPVKW